MQTSKTERISYGAYFAGQNMFYIIVSSYLTLFFLNKGLDETAIAAILLIPKVWDAVNDTLFGIIMDKVHFKNGRFIPWLRISWILIPLSTLFIFCMPDSLSNGGKAIWGIIGYVLWDTSYTICDAPIFALSTAMSTDVEERTRVLSIGRLFATVGAIVATLGIEALYMETGWLPLTIGLCIICMVLMAPVLFLAKERNHASCNNEPTFKEMVDALLKNKYLLIYYISYFLIASTMFVELLMPIFAQYVIGNTDVGTILIGICTIPVVIIAALLPNLSKKADKFWIYTGSLTLFALTSILQYFTNFNNLTILYITTFLRAIGYGGYNVLLFMFSPDLVEYGHYTTGKRQEGICFSLQTFTTKLTSAIVSSFSLILLSLTGFSSSDADPVTGIVDTAAAKGFWGIFTLVPVTGCLLAVAILHRFYKLRDRDVQLMSKCNNKEITRDECEKALGEK